MLTCRNGARKRSAKGEADESGAVAGLFDTLEIVDQSMEFDWHWACANKLDAYVAKHDARGKQGGEMAVQAIERVEAVLKMHYALVLSLFDCAFSRTLHCASRHPLTAEQAILS